MRITEYAIYAIYYILYSSMILVHGRIGPSAAGPCCRPLERHAVQAVQGAGGM